jgi:hypothetical protein
MEYALTSHNRSIYVPRPFGRFEVPSTFLQSWSWLRKAFIRVVKTSYTAETLCEIRAKIIIAILTKNILGDILKYANINCSINFISFIL